jgi:nucleoside-diphosphate-sugar epimerase
MSGLSGTAVLVTGGAGFVGGNLVRKLLREAVGHVCVVDNLLSAERWNIPDDARVRFLEGSAADPAVLWQLGDEFDYVFHLSTYHGNQSSIHDPLADHENNLLPTIRLFERIHGFRRLQKVVYAGAGCAVAEKTYDRARATVEDAPISLQMDSPYSISKIVGEFYAVYYCRRAGLPTVRARFQNVYGPGEILGAGRWRGTPATVWRNVVPTFIWKALAGEPLPLEGGGAASRDFIFVEDLVNGLVACALDGVPGDVYNLASGVETAILELARMINTATGNPAAPTELPRRDWDTSGHRFGSPEKASRELGFTAVISLHDGLARTVAWFREHAPLIAASIAKHAAHMRATREP